MKLFEYESLQAEYFDESQLKRPPYRLYRGQKGDIRLYTDGKRWFPGVTGLIEKVVPNESLMWWMIRKGPEQAARIRTERAFFGTLMHAQIAEVVRTQKIAFDLLPDIVLSYFAAHRLFYNLQEWVEELGKDLLAFAWWVETYHVTFYMVEQPLYSEALQVATQVDLVCNLDVKVTDYFGDLYKRGVQKGYPKKTTRTLRKDAILDLKSKLKQENGDNGGSPKSHEVQLAFCDALVKENFPEFQDTDFLLFNWHPVNWQTEPSAKMVSQTGKVSYQQLQRYSEIFHEDYNFSTKGVFEFTGTYELGSQHLLQHYTRQSLLEVTQAMIGNGGKDHETSETYR